MRFVLFPRAAGAKVQRVRLSLDEGQVMVEKTVGGGVTEQVRTSSGYSLRTDYRAWQLPLLPGSFVYSLPERAGDAGALYRVCEADAGSSLEDAEEVHAHFALQASSKAARTP